MIRRNAGFTSNRPLRGLKPICHRFNAETVRERRGLFRLRPQAVGPKIEREMIANTATKPTATTAFRTGDERLIRLTPNAAKKVVSLLAKEGRPNGVLRVAVVGGGCSGLQYKMDLQDGPADRDILVESGGVKVVVDPKSALYVTGCELDYLDALQDGGFKIKNPNAATSCSCGQSFSA